MVVRGQRARGAFDENWPIGLLENMFRSFFCPQRRFSLQQKATGETLLVCGRILDLHRNDTYASVSEGNSSNNNSSQQNQRNM